MQCNVVNICTKNWLNLAQNPILYPPYYIVIIHFINKSIFQFILNIATRRVLKTEKNLSNNKMRVLPETDKLEFVSKSVSWIEGRDIMDTCFILNFGYEAPLPWPQV